MNLLRPFILLFLLGLSCHAAAEPIQASKAPLWTVRSETARVDIYGSIHILPAGVDALSAPAKQAFNDADRLVFEANLQTDDPQQLQQQIAQRGFFPPADEGLEGLLDADDYAATLALLGGSGMPETQIRRIRPWFAAMTALNLQLVKLGLTANDGVDKRLMDVAREQGRATDYLETVQFQINVLAGMSQSQAIIFLKEALADDAQTQDQLNAMIHGWQSGDTAEITKLVKESLSEDPALYQRLFVDRNQRWVEAIKAYLAGKQHVFMAVGIGHLLGQDSVVEMLEKTGFEVERH